MKILIATNHSYMFCLFRKELVEALNRLYSFEQLNSMQETLFKDEE